MDYLKCNTYGKKNDSLKDGERVKTVLVEKMMGVREIIVKGEYGYIGYLEADAELLIIDNMLKGAVYMGECVGKNKENNSYRIVLENHNCH